MSQFSKSVTFQGRDCRDRRPGLILALSLTAVYWKGYLVSFTHLWLYVKLLGLITESVFIGGKSILRFNRKKFYNSLDLMMATKAFVIRKNISYNMACNTDKFLKILYGFSRQKLLTNSGLWIVIFLFLNEVIYHCFCFCLHCFAAENPDFCFRTPFYYLDTRGKIGKGDVPSPLPTPTITQLQIA